MMDANAIPNRRLDARTRNVRGVLYVAGPEQAFELSEVAALAWQLIDGRRSLAEIGELVATEYDVAVTEAIRDIGELLEQLQTAGALDVQPPAVN